MENYLEALERLGKLLDAGVLTRAEFEREKARLLARETDLAANPEPAPRFGTGSYIAAGSLVVLLLGGALGYSVYQSIADKGYSDASSKKEVPKVPEQLKKPARLSITFADAASCEPGPSLSELLGRIREAGAAEEGSTLRLIYLAGNPNPVDVQTILQDSGSQQVRLARIPVSTHWQALILTDVSTMDWDQGTGYQLQFQGAEGSMLRALRDAGFRVDALDKPMADGRNFIVVERRPGGAALICIRADAQKEEAGASSDLAEGGE